MSCVKIIACAILWCLLFSLSVKGQASKAKLYVWNFIASSTNFTASGTNLNSLAEKLTSEFEEALVKSRCYQVLERRNYNELVRHVANEKMIGTLKELSHQSQEKLQENLEKAQIVVFGRVAHDVESGEFKVSVSFQRFDSVKELVDSVLIKQGIINDASSREQAMKELVNKICPSSSMNAGDPKSNYQLAVKYEFGHGVEINYVLARKYCEMAAQADYCPAITRQGEWYLHGTLYTRDEEKAVSYFKQCAAKGDKNAQYLLGFCFENVIGIYKGDYTKREMKPHFRHHALHWFIQAAKNGHTGALDKLRKFSEELEIEKGYEKIGIPYDSLLATWPSDVLHRLKQTYPDSAAEFDRLMKPK
ncbi:MAG: tetratricopeptide repeat protein [Blastocatellia bacterium]